MEDEWIKKGTGFRPDDSPYEVMRLTCTSCDNSWMDDEDITCECEEDHNDGEEFIKQTQEWHNDDE